MKNVFLGFFIFIAAVSAHANSYTCAKMVYKDGWFTKYEYKGNTWGENTKKRGFLSSSAYSSTEGTTASLDPGVTTNKALSTIQYSSSWGECSALDTEIAKVFREKFIAQNLEEIKKQVAMGQGHHLDSLAYTSGCHGIEQQEWTQALQKNTASFYDSANSAEFAKHLDEMIKANPNFKMNCVFLANK